MHSPNIGQYTAKSSRVYTMHKYPYVGDGMLRIDYKRPLYHSWLRAEQRVTERYEMAACYLVVNVT